MFSWRVLKIYTINWTGMKAVTPKEQMEQSHVGYLAVAEKFCKIL